MMEQQPGFYRRRLGGWTATALNDGTLPLPGDVLIGIAATEMASLLAERFEGPTPVAAVNAVLLQGHGRTVLIDTGGGDMAPSTGRLSANLRAAGIDPGEVDTVLITHLHTDHTGGLARNGEAVFLRAELVLAEAEAAFWLGAGAAAAAPPAMRPFFVSAAAAVAPYQGRTRLVGDGAVLPGVVAVPLPGHTPGHTGFQVEGDGESLLVWGDVIHVPAVQARRPGACVVFDADPAQAEQSRRRALNRAASDRLLVAGMHLSFPGFCHVRAAGDGYDLVPEPWSPDL